MPGALDELGGFDMGLLRRNHFCMGVKRGNEYQCGGEAGEDAKSKAVELLAEAVRRILRWRVWETWWVEETMDEWLNARDRLEVQLKGKYVDEVVNGITWLVDKFISYNEQFLNYWREVGNEVRKLIEDLTNGGAEVIIWEGEKGISVYYGHMTLEVEGVRSDDITVQLALSDLEGMTIRVPDVFRKTMSRKEYRKFIKKMLKALRGGFEETDGHVEKGKAAMSTTQIWQVIVWSLLYPGVSYIHVDDVNVNENGVTIKWHLKSGHKSIKGKILSDIGKLSEEEILTFVFTAVLGDGSAHINKATVKGRIYNIAAIYITMSDKKFKRWVPLLERLKSMGFRSAKPSTKKDNAIDVPFYGSNAIGLSRAMIAVLPPILRNVFDALNFEKWLRIRRIAEMEVKFRMGEAQIEVAGYKFTVAVYKGTILLMHRARDEVEKDEVIDALRARYGDELAKYVHINKSDGYLVVVIPMYIFEEYGDIKAQVIEVLCRKLEKTKDERRRQIITKHLRRLAPTKGAAAANYPQPSLPWTQYRCAGAIW